LETTQAIDKKYQNLLRLIASKGSAAVAFSGGVDSSFLCYAAHEALGKAAVAVTVVSPMLSRKEFEDASRFARNIGIEHIFAEEKEIEPEVAENPRDRCYFCKKLEFARVAECAKQRGINTVFDGSNVDDLADYRPGMRALGELGIESPLKDSFFTKAEIRELSKRFALPSWDKPAFACLASRIPYGEKIDKEKLERVEKAEEVLRQRGFRQFRVRCHGNIARVEVAPEERARFFNEAALDSISGDIKACGFLYAALEMEGYALGNMNRG
jgi:uncharacterized protein